MKNPKLVIGIIAIVVLLIIFIVIYNNSKRVVTTKSGTSVQQAGLWETVMGIFGSVQGTKTGTTSNVQSVWCKIFPKSCAPKKYCDCSKPGFASDGKTDSLCNSYGMQFEQDCNK